MHHTRLQVAKRISRKVFRNYYGAYPEFIKDKSGAYMRLYGLHRKTKKLCSKACCGNPRRHFNEITFQEKIAAIREKEQVAEFYET